MLQISIANHRLMLKEKPSANEEFIQRKAAKKHYETQSGRRAYREDKAAIESSLYCQQAGKDAPTVQNLNPMQIENGGNLSFALLAFLSGVLWISFVIVIDLQPGPATDAQQLASFQGSPLFYNLHAILIAIICATGVPFFAGVGAKLRSRGNAFATAAVLLIVAGLVTVTINYVLFAGMLNAITAASNAPSAAEATYLAAIWSAAHEYLESLGAFFMGVGLVIFGHLSWKSEVFPNWLSIVGFVGGVGGIVAYFTSPTIVLLIFSLIIWASTSGILAIRGRL